MVRRLINSIRLSRRRYIDTNVSTVSDFLSSIYWADDAFVRMHVPVGMLVMQGGFRFNQNHPFVRALRYGRDELHRFYATINPANIAEFYGIEQTGRIGEDLSPWEIPWRQRKDRRPPPGEAGLPAHHGVSYYGPVSSEKLDVEMHRLLSLRDDIERSGFRPLKFGYPEGQIIFDGESALFFVQGGKHRAAVLSYLGHQSIPVLFRANLTRLVDLSGAAHFPLVRDGAMSESLAVDILRAYTQRDRSLELVNE